MVMFWVAILAISILLYVLLDGFDQYSLRSDAQRDEAARDVECGRADLGRQ